MIFQSLSSKLLILKSQTVIVSLKFEPYTPWNERIVSVVELWYRNAFGIGHPEKSLNTQKNCLGFLASSLDVLTLAKDMGDESKGQWLDMSIGWYCMRGSNLYHKPPHYVLLSWIF